MPRLHVVKLAQGLVATLPEELFAANVGYLPAVLGENLAEQVIRHEAQAKLGYFPALDYFRQQETPVDPVLLQLIDEVAAFVSALISRELTRRLSRAFSNVTIANIQAIAYTMPGVRPRQPDAVRKLAQHYAPNQVKVELVLSSIERVPGEGVEKLAREKVALWSRDLFETMELMPTRFLGPS